MPLKPVNTIKGDFSLDFQTHKEEVGDIKVLLDNLPKIVELLNKVKDPDLKTDIDKVISTLPKVQAFTSVADKVVPYLHSIDKVNSKIEAIDKLANEKVLDKLLDVIDKTSKLYGIDGDYIWRELHRDKPVHHEGEHTFFTGKHRRVGLSEARTDLVYSQLGVVKEAPKDFIKFFPLGSARDDLSYYLEARRTGKLDSSDGVLGPEGIPISYKLDNYDPSAVGNDLPLPLWIDPNTLEIHSVYGDLENTFKSNPNYRPVNTDGQVLQTKRANFNPIAEVFYAKETLDAVQYDEGNVHSVIAYHDGLGNPSSFDFKSSCQWQHPPQKFIQDAGYSDRGFDTTAYVFFGNALYDNYNRVSIDNNTVEESFAKQPEWEETKEWVYEAAYDVCRKKFYNKKGQFKLGIAEASVWQPTGNQREQYSYIYQEEVNQADIVRWVFTGRKWDNGDKWLFARQLVLKEEEDGVPESVYAFNPFDEYPPEEGTINWITCTDNLPMGLFKEPNDAYHAVTELVDDTGEFLGYAVTPKPRSRDYDLNKAQYLPPVKY